MKIISIGPAYPYRGGIASFNDRLTQQFAAEGHDIEINTFTLQYPEFLFPGKSQFTDSPPPENITIKRKINSINPFNWIYNGFRIKREKPDILLFRFWLPLMGPCFGTIARIAGLNNIFRGLVCCYRLRIWRADVNRNGFRVGAEMTAGIDGARLNLVLAGW